MSIDEDMADGFAAATTHAAIFILSAHGVFKAAALILSPQRSIFFSESQPELVRHPVISDYYEHQWAVAELGVKGEATW